MQHYSLQIEVDLENDALMLRVILDGAGQSSYPPAKERPCVFDVSARNSFVVLDKRSQSIF